jgi:hypothetical protein
MTDDGDRLEREIDVPFRFKRKPMPIAAELRPDWKIATLLLLLHVSSHAGKSSLKRLHVLNWAIRSPKYRKEFEEAKKNPLPLFGFNIRFEPAFSRATDLAVGDQLVAWVGGDRLQIAPKGKRWITEILKDKSLMQDERDFVSRIGKSVTEKGAEDVLGSRGSW